MADLWKLKQAPAGSSKKWQVTIPGEGGRTKTVKFGARGYEDYTQHKDKDRRENYRSRHRNDNIDDPRSPGFWSWWVLWGDTTDRNKAFASAVRRAKKLLPRKNPDVDLVRSFERAFPSIVNICTGDPQGECLNVSLLFASYAEKRGHHSRLIRVLWRDENEEIAFNHFIALVDGVAYDWTARQLDEEASVPVIIEEPEIDDYIEEIDFGSIDEPEVYSLSVPEAKKLLPRKNPDAGKADVQKLRETLMQRYPVSVWFRYRPDLRQLLVDSIFVDEEEQKRGIGTAVMRDINAWADANNVIVTLTPSAANYEKLLAWYENLGFVVNEDRRDIFETLYRLPKRTNPDVGMTESGRWGNEGSGILFFTPERRMLLLKRSDIVLEPGTWGIPGGAIPEVDGELEMTPLDSALREAEEEIGDVPPYTSLGDAVMVDDPDDPTSFRYTTFLFEVDEEFWPSLNEEHDDYLWVTREEALRLDLHPGVRELLEALAQ
jgi:8-oxo-dGTP pyrophosphatase MutT (NUDIX family)/GNAT superfamily N-acetyltransferase